MSCIVRLGNVIRYTDYEGEFYYYALDNVADSEGKVRCKLVSSTGVLLKDWGVFTVDTVLDDKYENTTGKLLKDCNPKEGELYLYKDTQGEWKVLKYTKFSIGYCFDSLTDDGKYNLPGSTFVYPLKGLTESMVKGTCEPKAPADVQDKLAEEYRSLREEYNKLSDDYEELYDSHNDLVSDYQVLREQKEDLEKKVEYYFDQCKHFQKEVDSLKKENEKLKTMNDVKTAAIENYIHPDNCKYWDGESCTVEAIDVKPYEEEIARLKDLVIKLTEELMERR